MALPLATLPSLPRLPFLSEKIWGSGVGFEANVGWASVVHGRRAGGLEVNNVAAPHNWP